jgi:hypothetical protein
MEKRRVAIHDVYGTSYRYAVPMLDNGLLKTMKQLRKAGYRCGRYETPNGYNETVVGIRVRCEDVDDIESMYCVTIPVIYGTPVIPVYIISEYL